MKRVVVVGGGVTGLSAAYALQKIAQRHGDLRIILIEGERRLGGKLWTDRVDGYVIERGPDSISTLKPWALSLAEELGLTPQMVGVQQQQAYVVRNRRLIPMPKGLVRPTRETLRSLAATPLISPLGKLRMGLDWFMPRRRAEGDESLASFFQRRLGREALEYVVEPLLAGIHAGDMRRLSMEATFPHFLHMEQSHGGLLRAILAQPAGQASAQAPTNSSVNGRSHGPFVSFVGGLQVLVDRLRSVLTQVEIHTGRQVKSVRHEPAASGSAGYSLQLDDGAQLKADAVVLTTPAFATADLVAGLRANLADHLRSIRYGSVIIVALGYRREAVSHPLAGSGFVVPLREARLVTACTWVSSKWANTAPDQQVLLRVHIGRMSLPPPVDASDEEILQAVCAELKELLGIHAVPMFARVFRLPRAMPQYEIGHFARLAKIQDQVATLPGLAVAGAAYRGLSLSDCVRQGYEAANGVAAYLGMRAVDSP